MPGRAESLKASAFAREHLPKKSVSSTVVICDGPAEVRKVWGAD